MEAKIYKLATGEKADYFNGKSKFTSAYKKNNTYDKCFISVNGMKNDIQVDKRYHGGYDKAILMGSIKHFKKYSELYKKDLDSEALGVNILIDNFDESNVNVGDIFQIADVIVQVTQPRQPCWKIGALFGKEVSRFIKNYSATGWYLKVLREGEVRKTDSMKLLKRESEYSICELTSFLDDKPSEKIIDKICSYDFVAQSYKDDLRK